MGTVPLVSEHPWKRSIRETPVDKTLTTEDGWDGIDVQWLVTAESVGSAEHVFGYTVIHPGGQHHLHRHPNAEEAQYLVSGEGIVRVEDVEITIGPGDVVFCPKNALHGFRCTSAEPAVMLWTYGGAVNLETAGYVRESEGSA